VLSACRLSDLVWLFFIIVSCFRRRV
jgi:hypothetical protein